MESVVHLIITGLIALQPIASEPQKWRIVVPEVHKHLAHIVVESADRRPLPPAGTPKYSLWPLAGHTATLATSGAVGSASYPKEMLKFAHGVCAAPAGDCAKVKHRADIDPMPALELWVGQAGISSTWSFPYIDWSIDRKKKSGNETIPIGEVAEEVCLTFKIPGQTLDLVLTAEDGSTTPISLAAKNNRIELRLGNVVPFDSGAHEQVDPHFLHYYDLSLRHDPQRDPADLVNPQSESGKEKTDHDHKLSLASIREGDGDVIIVTDVGAIALHGRRLLPSFTAFSPSGSNCPPIGGEPYP